METEKKDIIILGAGGSGFDIVSIILAINKEKPTWNILGFLDDNPKLLGKRFLNYNVLGGIDSCYAYKNAFFISSIAHSNNRLIREKIYKTVKSTGVRFASIIHPQAVIYEDVVIGEGCVVNANVVIGSRVKLGVDVHLAYGCNLGHEVIVGDHCSFGNGVNLSSGVIVGENSYIGCGVSSTYDVVIPPNTLVTVGSSVVRSLINSHSDIDNTWIGNPAELSYYYMKKQYCLEKQIRKT